MAYEELSTVQDTAIIREKNKMLELVVPTLEEMWFRKSLMADEETMAYNHAWGGTILFPRERWQVWYEYWIVNHENRRYYRYLKDDNGFVGEIAYHYDSEYDGYVANVIILSKFRGKGYGAKGLEMLCAAAKENGISVLYDDIAIDNTAIKLFLKQGFYEDYRTEEKIVLKKEL
ncbi:Acetyltransferase (GNAT) domain-containing protein [Lachnospiraceae bacterium XBB1006]|nr:Acetyltransferase (GNAT) domain-containing protein [Lachnospiraceae bacterium XBB1006]